MLWTNHSKLFVHGTFPHKIIKKERKYAKISCTNGSYLTNSFFECSIASMQQALKLWPYLASREDPLVRVVQYRLDLLCRREGPIQRKISCNESHLHLNLMEISLFKKKSIAYFDARLSIGWAWTYYRAPNQLYDVTFERIDYSFQAILVLAIFSSTEHGIDTCKFLGTNKKRTSSNCQLVLAAKPSVAVSFFLRIRMNYRLKHVAYIAYLVRINIDLVYQYRCTSTAKYWTWKNIEFHSFRRQMYDTSCQWSA